MKEMRLSKNFLLTEMCRTSSVKDNSPTDEAIPNLSKLVVNVLQPLRDAMGFTIIVSSGYRSPAVNKEKGGSDTSDHVKGKAADLKSQDNAAMFNYIKDHLEFDQLIWEEGNTKQPAWVHVSYREGKNRKQVLTINK